MQSPGRSILGTLLPLLAAAAILGCEQTPQQLTEVEASALEVASHGATALPRTVTVELREINGSGISGEVKIMDDGSTIVLSDGSATGMDPAKSFDYLSLFYDKASPPNGPRACEPGVFDSSHPLFLTEDQMLGGIWAVDSSGNGSVIDLGGEYVPVDMIGTVSIRDLTINGGFGPAAVVACGKVTHDPVGPRL